MHQHNNIDESVVPWMIKTTKCVGIFISEMLNEAEIDLTRTQWALLKWLHDKDGSVQNNLALITNRNKASLTRLIHTMERKELVVRISDKKDKRINRIFLTERGRKIYESTLPIIHATIEHIQEGLSESEVEQFIFLLNKIKRNITDCENTQSN